MEICPQLFFSFFFLSCFTFLSFKLLLLYILLFFNPFLLFRLLSFLSLLTSESEKPALNLQHNQCEALSPRSSATSHKAMELSFEEKDFLACCGSTKFANQMALASPFASLEEAVGTARDIWFNNVDVSAWLQAFSAHPQIGDSTPSSHHHHPSVISAQLS